jgi:HPt (histidine-containing phosphotransfer) domain-containing protein
MSLHLQRIDWMPSPPLVPDQTPLDLVHLDRVTFGDVGLQAEVLALFAAQTAVLMPELVARPHQAGALAHTLKGSAKAIGAHRVAEAAEAFEDAPHAQQALRELQNAVIAACAAIDARLLRC